MPTAACPLLRRVVLLISLIWLTACAARVSDPVVICPAVRDYPPAFSQRLADEVQALPPDSAAVTALIDYVELRDRLRACQ